MPLVRQPRDVLRPFVQQLWASDPSDAPPGAPSGSGREAVLPSVSTQLVIRLAEQPLRVFRHRDDLEGYAVSTAVIGGPRLAPYLKDVSRPVPTVGAALRPGVAGLLIGAPAGTFVGRHLPLEDVWGAAPVAVLRAALWEAGSAAQRLAIFEAALVVRLPKVTGLDPLVAQALAGFDAGAPVGAVVTESGYSHRTFTRRFAAAVGLKPKTYARLQRFGRALDPLAKGAAAAGAAPSLADLAAWHGYADQAHFVREFRQFSGLTPGCYRRLAPAFARHVAL
ncbi:AraC family transcriptional regulator [Pelagibius sp.]|uniref:helix-turn-helix domain-containing protein n=1 Tax=Pelagibius sp. TaxID=1931238 RepID=UPI002625287B|nr:AraC family transcriptional regulator [Pelagibius sp.]